MTNRAKTKGRRDIGNYAALPHALLDHPDFGSLSGSATKVLLHLLRQYNGKNNGNLSAPLSAMKSKGVKSDATLTKAIGELMQARWIRRTRTGRFMNPGSRCALYAVEWLPIDECPGKDLEEGPTRTPARKLSLEASKTPTPKNEVIGFINRSQKRA